MALSFKIKLYSSLFITLALHIWGPTMANGCVLFFTDNAALVDIINKRASKTLTGHDSYYVTYYSAARYGGGRGYIILFRASHVPGLKNSRTSPVYRWRDSRNSRRRRTNFQQQCQRTYSRRVGQSLERMLLGSVLATGSRSSYLRAWLIFAKFRRRFLGTNPSITITFFISNLSAKKLAPSKIVRLRFASVLSCLSVPSRLS